MRVGRASRYLAAVLIVIWLAPLSAMAEDETAAQSDQVGQPKQQRAGAPGADRKQRAVDRAERAARRDELRAKNANTNVPPRIMWWNEDTIVAELGLSKEQREKFDSAMEKVEAEEPARNELPKVRRSYYDALKAGDMKTAEARLADMIRLTAQPVEQQGGLKLTVFGSLSQEQRAKLAQKYASIVASAWRPRVQWGPPRKMAQPKPKKEAAD